MTYYFTDDRQAHAMTILGVDIGSTHISAALVTPDNEVKSLLTAAQPEGDGEAALQNVIIPMGIEVLKQALADDLRVQGIGVGVAAHMNVDGSVLHAPKLPGWTGTPVAAILQQALSLPAIADRDIHLMARAERYAGTHDYETMLYLHIGEHITGTLMRHDEPWRGSHLLADGIGAMVADWRGEKPITLEEIAAVPGIEWMFQSRSPNVERVTFPTIVRLAKEGKPLALKVLRDSGRIFGIVIAPVIAQFDPDMVVIGGSVSETGGLWWQSFEATLRESSLAAVSQVVLSEAKVQQHAVLHGAASMARAYLRG